MNFSVAREHGNVPRRQRLRYVDWPFWGYCVGAIGVLTLLIVGMLVAGITYAAPWHLWAALQSPEILAAIRLSLITSTISAGIALLLGIPIAYVLARTTFPGKDLLEIVLTLPLALPPLVIGVSLLLLLQSAVGIALQQHLPVTYTPIAVVLAQLPVACALVIRTMRASFDLITPRQEHVAWTLGCTRRQAFWHIVLPQARRGVASALALAWSRSLAEFGAVLVFAGATRMRTEVLPTTIYLELSTGRIESALAVSTLLLVIAVCLFGVVRMMGTAERAR